MKFKEGDRIKMLDTCTGAQIGKEYYLKMDGPTPRVWGTDERSTGPSEVFLCSCSYKWEMACPVEELLNNNNTMAEVNTVGKKMLDAETQILMEGGMLDERLNITALAVDEMRAIKFVENKTALLEVAKANIEKAKAQ